MSPFRPFAPAAVHHVALEFDWPLAIQQLQASVAAVDPMPCAVLTDLATQVPGDAIRLEVGAPDLMRWLLGVWHAYLASPAFDQDTLMLSPDLLVCRPMRPLFEALDVDLALLVRRHPKFFTRQPLLNGVQFWAHRAKPRLAAFFAQALEEVPRLAPSVQSWGADTFALWSLLEPVSPKDRVIVRGGLRIALLEADSVLTSVSSGIIAQARAGVRLERPRVPVLDFRYRRKAAMSAVYAALEWPAGPTERTRQ